MELTQGVAKSMAMTFVDLPFALYTHTHTHTGYMCMCSHEHVYVCISYYAWKLFNVGNLSARS